LKLKNDFLENDFLVKLKIFSAAQNTEKYEKHFLKNIFRRTGIGIS
jgi:hypothetical protein